MASPLLHIVTLSMIKDIGPILGKYLIAYCGGAQQVLEASVRDLARIPNIGVNRANKIKHDPPFERAQQQIDYCAENDISIYHYLMDAYPRRLKNYEGAPIVLYFRGSGELNHPRTIGVVGTRKPSERGKLFCQQLIADLQPYDVQIVSGLAHGIDTMAHKTSLEQGMETLAVQGHGHDIVYPAQNRALAKRICNMGGLLSEFPILSRADREHFPMRNRIIAMQSDALVVVESGAKGGSMITANFANDCNKDVFALPGRISDEQSQGCNALIKTNRAHLLESVKDIAYIMGWDLDKIQTQQATLFVELLPEEQAALDVIKDRPNITIDELQYVLQVNHSSLASLMIALEFKGMIRSLPGKKFFAV